MLVLALGQQLFVGLELGLLLLQLGEKPRHGGPQGQGNDEQVDEVDGPGDMHQPHEGDDEQREGPVGGGD